MKILVNLVPLCDGAIVREKYLFKSLAKLDQNNQYIILGQLKWRKLFDNLGSNFKFLEINLLSGQYLKRFLWENFKLPFLIKKFKADILYFPHQLTNIFNFCKTINAVQNALPFEKELIKQLSFWNRFKIRLLAVITKISIRSSDGTIFFSEYLKRKVLKNRPQGYFPVIRHGPVFNPSLNISDREVENFLADYNADKNYILIVSHIYRYKNLLAFLQGYQKAKDRCPDLEKLIIAGEIYDKEYFQEIQDYIEKYSLGNRVKFIGKINHNDLPYLYSGCKFFAFPTKCENAPVTLMEALAFGLPIICSSIEANMEICGGSALCFHPDNVMEISECLNKIHENQGLRDELKTKALRRAKFFSWEKCARETLKAFEDII